MTDANRMAALEAVVQKARVWCASRPHLDGDRGTFHDTQALFDALRALDALPAAPAQAQGETVEVAEPKTVQIAAISPGDGVAPCIFALRDDGTIWGKRVDSDNATWWREDAIPTIRATVATEGGGE
jgi:hypothetical protein